MKAKQLQDQRLATLEHSILDLNGIVERCQREIDKNNSKREQLKQANAQMANQLSQL